MITEMKLLYPANDDGRVSPEQSTPILSNDESNALFIKLFNDGYFKIKDFVNKGVRLCTIEVNKHKIKQMRRDRSERKRNDKRTADLFNLRRPFSVLDLIVTRRKADQSITGSTISHSIIVKKQCEPILTRHEQVRKYNVEMYGHETLRGLPGELNHNWQGGKSFFPYCDKFNDRKREEIRNKYGRKCYICHKNEEENITHTGKIRKLSVHHIDADKGQGCNGKQWKLIPLCLKCHNNKHMDEAITAKLVK